MKMKLLLTTFVIASVVLTTGCRDDSFKETRGECPTVVSTNPANLATNVPLSQVITVTFNEDMDATTVNNSTFILYGSIVEGTVTYANKVATFTPTHPLIENHTYTGKITTGMKDLHGNAIQDNYVWTFSTGAILRPMVIATNPFNTETGVVINKIVTATFNLDMDATSITDSTFTLKTGTTLISGAITYADSTASFDPNVDLLPNTVYTATIKSVVKNAAGNAMLADHVWTFTTGTLVAPKVTLTDPLNNATGVALNQVISATFDMPMDAATLQSPATTFVVKLGAVVVPGLVSYAGNTASFTPASNLIGGSQYTVTISTGAKNVAGTGLANNYVWKFTTLVLLAPTVTATDPLNNAINIPLNKILTADFSVPMDAGTISGTTFTLKHGATSVAGNVSYLGSTATFTPSSPLLSETTYTATITTGAKNVAGTALAANYVWTFTTVAHLGPNAPNLNTAAAFGGFGGNAGVTNQGLFTVINNGGIGTTAASTLITGFHDGLTADVYTETPLNVGLVTGGINTAPPFPGTATSFAKASAGLLDAQNAYNSISPASKPGGTDPGAGELGGLTLAPGIYKSASGTFKITNGDLTLDAQGDPKAVWIFQTAAGLTVGIAGPTGAKSVNLINGAMAKNVFWYIGSAATINAAGGGTMVGTIIANSGVVFSTAGNATQTVLNGRAISLISSVTMVNTTINVPLP